MADMQVYMGFVFVGSTSGDMHSAHFVCQTAYGGTRVRRSLGTGGYQRLHGGLQIDSQRAKQEYEVIYLDTNENTQVK